MNTLKILKSSLMLMIIAALVSACSKDSEHPPGDQNLKNTGVGDKIFSDHGSSKTFAWEHLNNMFTNNDGIKDFSQYGGMNFSNNAPGQGGGTLPNTGSGILTANGVQIPIVFGAYLNYGDDYFDIYLLNQPIELDEDEYPGLSGIIFEIVSGSNLEILPGDYVYSDAHFPFTFPYATVGIDTETPNEQILDVEGGELSIAKSGNNYTLQFSGILENGSTFSGNYSGTLIMLEEDNEPPPGNGTLSATIDGTNWNAAQVGGYTDDFSYISITGFTGGGDQYLSFELNYPQVSQGAQLSINNGGVFYASYGMGGNYYTAYEVANVNITSFNGTSISGTFNFIGEDFIGNSISVTNGSFQNVNLENDN